MDKLEKDIKMLVDLAMESESSDPIDWGELNLDKRTAYELMARHLIEDFNIYDQERFVLLLAVCVHLTVENFVLNLKLRSEKG